MGILLYSAVSQTFILTRDWQGNALARVPAADAEAYWNWASEIATGHWVGATPFLSAPLYPYVLGLMRALGGGLLCVYIVQAVVHVATVGLIAVGAARRFDPVTGLIAGGLFALLTEPAYFGVRVLNCTWQLFLVVLLWLALLRAQRRASLAIWAIAGALCGVNCLLNPPMLVAIPLLAVWAWWEGRWRWRGVANAAIFAVGAAALVSPATIHNYKVCREFIPVSAQAGVTFAQGNAPASKGIYTPIAGVSRSRELQNLDALRVYRQSTGEAGGWNAASRFFFRQGLQFWRTDPAGAAVLLLCKAYWFVTGRYAGDIYVPELEMDAGLNPWLHLSPVPLPWVMPLALVGVVVMAFHGRKYFPELLLFVVPLLVVVVFFFTPRYRLPAVPIVVVAGGWAAANAIGGRARWKWAAAVVPAVALGIGSGYLNRAIGFDRADDYRAEFRYGLGGALWRLGRLDEARENYVAALARRADFAPAAAALGGILNQQGQAERAAEYLEQAAGAAPQDPDIHNQLGRALVSLNRLDEALREFEIAVRLSPASAELHTVLAVLLIHRGDYDGALEHLQTALRAAPGYPEAHLNLGIVWRARGEYDASLRELREALRLNPASPQAHLQTGKTLLARGDASAGFGELRRACELAPQDGMIATELVWHLATTPNLSASSRAKALELAQQLLSAGGGRAARVYEALAVAVAADGEGRFGDARRYIERAIALADQQNDVRGMARMRRELEAFSRLQPYAARPEDFDP